MPNTQPRNEIPLVARGQILKGSGAFRRLSKCITSHSYFQSSVTQKTSYYWSGMLWNALEADPTRWKRSTTVTRNMPSLNELPLKIEYAKLTVVFVNYVKYAGIFQVASGERFETSRKLMKTCEENHCLPLSTFSICDIISSNSVVMRGLTFCVSAGTVAICPQL